MLPAIYKSSSSSTFSAAFGIVCLHYLSLSFFTVQWYLIVVLICTCITNNFDYKEIQPVHPKGDQSWVLIGRTDARAETPILWPPQAKSRLIGKDPDAGRD